MEQGVLTGAKPPCAARRKAVSDILACTGRSLVALFIAYSPDFLISAMQPVS